MVDNVFEAKPIGVRGGGQGGQLTPPNLEKTRFGQIAPVELRKINF